MYKESNYLLFERGDYIYSRGFVYCLGQMFQRLHLFKGLRLFWTEYEESVVPSNSNLLRFYCAHPNVNAFLKRDIKMKI